MSTIMWMLASLSFSPWAQSFGISLVLSSETILTLQALYFNSSSLLRTQLSSSTSNKIEILGSATLSQKHLMASLITTLYVVIFLLRYFTNYYYLHINDIQTKYHSKLSKAFCLASFWDHSCPPYLTFNQILHVHCHFLFLVFHSLCYLEHIQLSFVCLLLSIFTLS